MPEPQDERENFTIGNKWLPVMFEMVVGHKCDYEDEKDRRFIQCIICLLQCYGVPIGDYGFDLLKQGVYSFELIDDLHYELYERKNKPTYREIDPYFKRKITIVRKYMTKDCGSYEPLEYMEALSACCLLHVRYIWDKNWRDLAKEYEKNRKKYGFAVDSKLAEKAAKEIRKRFKY